MSDTTQNPQPIIDLILADINAVIPNFSSLVSSYRLLVGSAEEIQRTPNICPDVFERAVRRFDNTGTLIDILLELLCCKIAFSSDFLSVSCAPVDLFRLLANPTTTTDTPHNTAEQVVGLEILRRVLEKCDTNHQCLPCHPVICPESPATNNNSSEPAATHTGSDCKNFDELETNKLKDSQTSVDKELGARDCFESHLRPSHFRDFFSRRRQESLPKTSPSRTRPRKS